MSGHAVAAGAVGTRTRCALVQGGRVVASWQNALPGPAGATGGTATIAAGPYQVCIMDLYVQFADAGEVRYQGCL